MATTAQSDGNRKPLRLEPPTAAWAHTARELDNGRLPILPAERSKSA